MGSQASVRVADHAASQQHLVSVGHYLPDDTWLSSTTEEFSANYPRCTRWASSMVSNPNRVRWWRATRLDGTLPSLRS
jgi:hypothetical protein